MQQCIEERMKKSLWVILFVLSALASSPVKAYAAEDSHSYICEDNGITVVSIYGTWHQMGCQYGELVGDKMTEVLDYIDSKLGGRSESIDSAYVLSEKLYASTPEYFKEFFKGIGETSGISLDRIKLCNAVEYIEELYFCSFMAVWSPFSTGKLVAGRNYDAASFNEIGKDIIVTVFHPEDEIPAAIVGYAGELYCVNGFNGNGFFFELNNGMPSAGPEIHWDLCPSTSRLLELLFKTEKMDDVETFFSSTQSFASFIIGVCNKDEARSYEWCYDGMKRGDVMTIPGLVINTNHYINSDWDYVTPTDETSWNSISRWNNLLGMAEKYKGHIDAIKMEEIMSTAIEDGGPLHELTRYQIVVIPEDFTLNIFVPHIGMWSEINLKNYF